MRLGVVAAVRAELGPTLRALRTRTKRHAGMICYEAGSFAFVVAGIGSERAGRTAAFLVEKWNPDALISAGFAGALVGDLKAGDLILGGSGEFEPTEELLKRAEGALIQAKLGKVVTVDEVILDAGGKKRLAARTGALAVDMESAAVAGVAKRFGLGFLSVKAVLDTPAAPLASNYRGLLKVLGQIARRPKTIAGIRKDAARAREAALRLAEFFLQFSLSTAGGSGGAE